MIRRFQHRLFQEVDNSPLIVFRVLFGLLIAAEAGGAILTGWVTETMVEPAFTFTFIGFEWLRMFNGPGMYGYYAVMALAGLAVAAGWRYKWAMGTYAFMWWGVYLMQKAHYNNHYYLLILLCFMMWVVPAHRYFSLDVKRRPDWERGTCPQWCLWIFVALVCMVYFYAGIAKIHADWLAGIPHSIWFSAKSNYPLIGPLLQKPWMIILVAYGGIAFDLLVAPLMLWRKTRIWAFGVGVFFHLFNSIVFQIGVFPYMMIAIAIFFFPPNKMRTLFFKKRIPPQVPTSPTTSPTLQKWITATLVIFFAVQIALPLRHHFFEGNVSWTEEGHRMSWRMMLRSKSGRVTFLVKHPPTGEEWKINPADYLSKTQSRKIGRQPDMIWSFVQYLKEDFANRNISPVEIYAKTHVSLNRRPSQDLVDPTVNLAEVPWNHFKHAFWIIPLKK